MRPSTILQMRLERIKWFPCLRQIFQNKYKLFFTFRTIQQRLQTALLNNIWNKNLTCSHQSTDVHGEIHVGVGTISSISLSINRLIAIHYLFGWKLLLGWWWWWQPWPRWSRITCFVPCHICYFPNMLFRMHMCLANQSVAHQAEHKPTTHAAPVFGRILCSWRNIKTLLVTFYHGSTIVKPDAAIDHCATPGPDADPEAVPEADPEADPGNACPDSNSWNRCWSCYACNCKSRSRLSNCRNHLPNRSMALKSLPNAKGWERPTIEMRPSDEGCPSEDIFQKQEVAMNRNMLKYQHSSRISTKTESTETQPKLVMLNKQFPSKK